MLQRDMPMLAQTPIMIIQRVCGDPVVKPAAMIASSTTLGLSPLRCDDIRRLLQIHYLITVFLTRRIAYRLWRWSMGPALTTWLQMQSRSSAKGYVGVQHSTIAML
jgi:hypothetical protein